MAEEAILLCFESNAGGGYVRAREREELLALLRAVPYQVHDVVAVSQHRLRLRHCLSSGKSKEIQQLVKASAVKKIITSHSLSPFQARCLEQSVMATVVDRNALILEIFARRAHSHEGKLQVELAQLEYMSTRLVRSWLHLERQKGGIGVRGGPGEKQVETDRRLIRLRMSKLRSQLRKIKNRRHVSRRLRARRGVFSIALIGYTNAGKTTLFNRLTKAKAYVADALFATLDPVIRRLWSGPGAEIVISDTVGFIKDLPPSLLEAFHATLLEVNEADLLLHVVDDSDRAQLEHRHEVQTTLRAIHADTVPQLLISNKIDLSGTSPAVWRNDKGEVCSIAVSGRTGAGVELMRRYLIEYCRQNGLSNGLGSKCYGV